MALTLTTSGILPTTDALAPAAPVFNPLSGEDGFTWSADQAERNALAREKQRTRLDKMDAAILDPAGFFAKNPFNPAFADDPEKAKRRVFVSAYLRHENGGAPLPMGSDGHEMFRRKVAAARFEGRGAEDDDAFHAELVKSATARRDTKEIARQIIVSASDDAMLPSGMATGFKAAREKVKTLPGYKPEMDADMMEAWAEQRAVVAEKIAPFKEPLQDVWNEFSGKGNITGAAFTAWAQIPPENRRDFLEALALRAKALPDEQRETFWQNMRKVTEQAVGDFARQAAESQQNLALKGTVPTMAGNVRFMSPEESARLGADFTAQRNFAADVRQIFREDYDPLTSAFREGKPGFWEGITYETPGVTATSLSMAVPVVGPAAMAFSMEGAAYESTRAKLLSQGMDDARASEIASGLAPLIAAPQFALEKVGFGIWSRKLPGFSNLMDNLGNRITNRALRMGAKTVAIGAAETAVEIAQDTTQAVFQSLADDVPGVDWGSIAKEQWANSPEIFFTMLPLSILGAAGGLSREARAAAFAQSTPLERKALGITDEASRAIDAAAKLGPASLNTAIENAMASRDPNGPDAVSAVQEMKAKQASQAKAQQDLERLGYATPRFVQTQDGISVVDSVSGEELGQAPDLSGAIRIAKAHTTALDDLEADQVAALGTLMEGARAAAELDPNSAVEVRFDETFDPEQADPARAARYAAQVALIEQAEGGTGQIAMNVLGESETTFAGNLRNTINRIYRGGTVLTVFHETFHGLRRQARAAGTITREDEIAMLRALDSVLAGKTTKSGSPLRFIPEGMADADISETLLDEAFSEIGEIEVLRTRKGAGKSRLGLTRGIISRNLSALAKLIPGVAGKFSAFLRAVRAHWGLSLSRAIAIKKAERDGKFDTAGYDAYLNKILGLDEQVSHDDGVRAELNRIMGLEYDPAADDIPFSIGRIQENSAFSIGPSDVPAILADSALKRITDPRRRTQVMSRISRDFNDLRLQTDRLLALSGRRRSKAELRQAASAREEMRAEELIEDVHRRFFEVLTQEDLTKIKSQPVHEYLANPDSPLRGRLLSKKRYVDRNGTFQSGQYNGSEGVSRSVFGGWITPGDAATNLFDAGLIGEPTADAMWQALLAEQNSVSAMKEQLAKAQEQIREAKREAKREATEWLNTQAKDQEENFNPREEILRSLRLLDAILLALPVEIRGKIGGYTQMARITTNEAKLSFLKDKLAKADKELEIFLREQFGKEFEELMKRARPTKDAPGERPSGSIDPEAWEIFKQADAATRMRFAEAEGEATKWDTLADHEDTSPADAEKFRTTAQIIRLTQNWTAADAARREQAVLELEKIYHGGLMALRMKLAAKADRQRKLRDSARAGTKKTGSRMERKAAKLQGGKLAWEFMSFGQTVNVIAGENSDFAKWANGMELACSNSFEDAMQAKVDAFESMLENLAGSRFGGEKLRHKMQTEESIKVTDALGVEQTFTEVEAIQMLLEYRQEDGKRHYLGIMDDDGNIVSQWAWNDESVAEIERQLSPQGHQMFAFLGDSYGSEYDRINDVFTRVWNAPMPRHKLYAPIASLTPQQSRADTIMDPQSGEAIGYGMTPSSLKNRSQTAVAEPTPKDAFQVYLSHARQMEHFIAYAEFSRDALAVVNRRDTKNAIEAAGGQPALNTLLKWIDFYATGGIRDASMGSTWSRMIGNALGRLSQAQLVGRVSVLAMQSLQLAAAAYKMPLGSFLTRFAKLTTGRLSWGDSIRSAYIQRRISEMPPIVRDAIRGLEAGSPNRAKYLAAKAGRTIAGADGLFTAGTYAILYDYHLKQNGGDEAAAHAEAERLTDQIAQPTRPGARSMLELQNAGNPAFRALWNFSSDPRQKVSLIVYEMMRRDKSGAAKIGAASKAFALTWGVSGILQAVVRAVIRDLRSDEDEEVFDERHWNLKRLSLQAATGPLGAFPYLGNMLEGAVYSATGTFTSDSSLLSAFADMGKVGYKWWKHGDVDPLQDAEAIFTGGATASGTSAALASGMHLVRDAWALIENLDGPDQ